MADLNPTIPHLKYRKRTPPSASEVLAEAKELLRYDEKGGFVWVKLRGRVPLKLIGSVAGGESGRGYLTVNILHHRFAVHRLVWLWHNGDWPNGMVDHINGDRKDNRIENLRIVTAVQNVWNRAKKSGSLAIGVAKNSAGKFVSRIQLPGGERVYLGTFETEAEAAAAYIGASTVLQGEFSVFRRKMPGLGQKITQHEKRQAEKKAA